MATANAPRRASRLLERITCPHCWEQFSPERTLWISEHIDLLGDQRLGPEKQQRFLPTRFTVDGEALDAKGFPCRHLACPNCHLGIPQAMLEMEPLFLSIFGAPASGKSYFLAAMTWELRKLLGIQFGISFSDADPVANQSLTDYEESLFVNSKADSLIPLASLIRKTEEQGDLYDTVSFGSQTVSYPRPFLFSMQPQAGHPHAAKADQLARVVCLYDNAGESFQPGRDTASTPVTRHLARSRTLFYVFDPTQDNRFRQHCQGEKAVAGDVKMARQEPILQEAAARIRRYAGLRQSEKHNRPLVVILTKCDAWSHLLGEDPPPEPWRQISRGVVGEQQQDFVLHALDTSIVERRSRKARELMLRLCPEIVSAAESFAKEVIYVPVSAVGWNAEVDTASGLLAIRPAETAPHWVAVPFLYALCRWSTGLIPSIVRKPERKGDAP